MSSHEDVAAPLGCVGAWAVRHLAAPRGACAGRSTVMLLQSAPVNFSSARGQEQPPGNTGNKLPQPLQKEKHPGNPVQTRCRRCRAAPGVAGGSRGGPYGWTVFAGTDPSVAPPLSPVPVCGRLRAKSIFRVPTTRLQSETKTARRQGGVMRSIRS